MVTIHTSMNQVYGSLDGADAAPTVQALAMLGELEKVSAEQLNEFKQLRDGVLLKLNPQLRQAGSAEISRSYEPEPQSVQGAEKSEE
jgi:hypothetical protein